MGRNTALQRGLPGIEPDYLVGEGFTEPHMREPSHPLPVWLLEQWKLRDIDPDPRLVKLLGHAVRLGVGFNTKQLAVVAALKTTTTKQYLAELRDIFHVTTTAALVASITLDIDRHERLAG